MNLHEYQKKGLTKKAFRNSLILKGVVLVVFGLAGTETTVLKRKVGASSRTPHAMVYNVKYTQNH
jgi:hypothetical protein